METKLTYKIVKTEEQYQEYIQRMEELDDSMRGLQNVEIEEEIELIQLLVEDYESKYMVPKYTDPADLLKMLLVEHQLTASKLANELEIGKSILSEILSKKRKISKEIAKKLSLRFKMNAGSFI